MREPSNRRSPALVLAASALGLTFAAPMTAWANEAAERLTERLDPLENYHATFEQQILDGGGERLQSARGEMWLSRPGMLRWEVEAPYSQTVVSDGEDVYLYDPDLEQVTVQAMDDRVTHTPALLLSGSADELTASYDVFYEQQDGDDIAEAFSSEKSGHIEIYDFQPNSLSRRRANRYSSTCFSRLKRMLSQKRL